MFRHKPAIYRPHPYLLYELTPNYVSADGLTHHNSYGFRGQEFSVAKSDSMYRVVCMGESTTYCTGIKADDATYPARLEAHLRLAGLGRPIEVLNAGVGGYTSMENLLHFVFKVQLLMPDLVVFYYTHNDVHPRRLPALSRDYREYSKSWYEPPRLTPRQRLRRLLQAASGAPPDIADRVRRYAEYAGRRQASNIPSNSAGYFWANMKSLALLAKGWGIELLLVNPPYRYDDVPMDRVDNPAYRAVQEHRQAIIEVGRDTGCHVYDLARDMPYPMYRSGKPWQSEYYQDSVHVNERGADLMAQSIARACLPLIEKRSPTCVTSS